MDDRTKCPFSGGKPTNRDWWPKQLSIEGLHRNSGLSDPMGKEFDYAKEFKTLDLNAVVKDLTALPEAVATLARRGDLVITLGAGSIGSVGDRILTALRAREVRS